MATNGSQTKSLMLAAAKDKQDWRTEKDCSDSH